jgi:transposase, IS5 family
MRPRERRETSEQDLFRSRLDQIIDMNHALGKLARAIDWRFLEESSERSTPTSRVNRRCRRG